MFRAVTREPELLPRLLEVDGMVAQARRKAEEYVGQDPAIDQVSYRPVSPVN